MQEEYKKYQELTFDLGVERKDEELEISGDFILVEYLDGTAYLKLDNPGHDAIDLTRVKQINTSPQKFNKIYITNSAQSGKTLKLLVGGAASFTASPTDVGNVIIQDTEGEKAEVIDISAGSEYVLSGSFKGLFVPAALFAHARLPSEGLVAFRLCDVVFDQGFTTTGTSSTLISSNTGFKTHTWVIRTDASSSNATVRLEGSLDGSNWFTLDEWSGTGSTMRHVVNKLVREIRINVVDMGDATEVRVDIMSSKF